MSDTFFQRMDNQGCQVETSHLCVPFLPGGLHHDLMRVMLAMYFTDCRCPENKTI